MFTSCTDDEVKIYMYVLCVQLLLLVCMSIDCHDVRQVIHVQEIGTLLLKTRQNYHVVHKNM